MSNKNIWIINQYAGTPKYGMNYRSYYVAKQLLKHNYSVTIFSSSYTHQRVVLPETKGLFTEEYIDGIRFIWVKTPKYKSSNSLGRFISMIYFMIVLFFYKDKQKPTNIIASSLSIFSTLNAYLWAKKYKVDFIFEVRDLWPQTYIDLKNSSKYNPIVLFMSFFEKLGYKKSKATVSLLSNAKEHMLKKGLENNRYFFIPNGIDLEEVQKIEPLSKIIKDKIPKNKFIVGYTGTVGIANSMEVFCKAAKKMSKDNKICFVIVGDGKEKKYLEDKYSSLDNLIFVDAIPKKQIQNMLKLFDICYIGWQNKKIYKYGVSPNKIYDYMYSGKPILHAYSGKNDIVSIAKCGITVKALDEKEIIKAIYKFYKMPKEYREKLGENGREYVIDNYSYDKLIEKYFNILMM